MIMTQTDTLFDEFLQTQLNPEQLKAVLHPHGSLLVVAGAGSGKTRVITARITHLICNAHAEPSSIVALTFTNKAAQEMKERMLHFLGDTVTLPFIGTFHSYCLRFLKLHSHVLSVPFISVLDEDDQHTILNGIIKRAGLNKKVSAKTVSYQISRLKNESFNPEELVAAQSNRLLQDIFNQYEHEKQLSKSLDFDDLLIHTVKLLKSNADILQNTQQHLCHVLVDEYQDTNAVQHELLRCLTQKNNQELVAASVCVVGDEDQSIYSWRGATVANILHFTRDFPQTTIIKLEQNYRSAQSILDVANAVIKNNQQRNPKNLWSTRSGKQRVAVCTCTSEYQEADMVVSLIKKNETQSKGQTHAVLYRAHYQSRAIEEALLKAGIAYTIIGGIRFYERKEIKDLIAYLRLIVNPFDRTACARVINCPNRGLGEVFQEQFFERWNKEPLLNVYDLIKLFIKEQIVTGKKEQGLAQFVSVCSAISPDELPSAALKSIVEKSGYKEYLQENFETNEAESKIENIKELIQAAHYFESEGKQTISAFLDTIALLQEKIDKEQKSKSIPVVLMTLHAAKGLEFDTVALIGLNEDLFPSVRSQQEADGLEEERRLFYVGITRAKERLLLTHTRYRHQFGQVAESMPSRFVREIPGDLIFGFDISYSNNAQIAGMCAEWLALENAAAQPRVVKCAQSRSPVIAPAEIKPVQLSSWKKNQPVSHPTFGNGLVSDIELRPDGTTYITARFKSGTKKIAAVFLNKI